MQNDYKIGNKYIFTKKTIKTKELFKVELETNGDKRSESEMEIGVKVAKYIQYTVM